MFSNLRFKPASWLAIYLGVFAWLGISSISLAQVPSNQGSSFSASPSEPTAVDAATLRDLAEAAKEPKPATVEGGSHGIDFLSLLLKGGVLLIPIAFLSLMVVMFIFERFIGLRNGKIIPRAFVRKIVQLSRDSESIDPRIAYRICQEHPSVASNVVRAMLLRTGRPQEEIQSAAAEVNQREADKAHAGVRWLSFSAGIAPLLGLLGTVWGLIQAFHDLSFLGPNQSRADHLSRGIYEALVATMTGLVVAIIAGSAAHFFESRIVRVFRKVEELVFALVPKLERYEGRVRFDPIGRELVARNIEPIKKPAVASLDNPKTPPSPPVQGTPVTSSGTHVAPTAQRRNGF